MSARTGRRSAMGSRMRRARARPSIGRSQIPRSARLTRSTRISTIDVPVGSTVARRMMSRSSATAHEQAPATSIAASRDVVPSSEPTRTTRPNGPAANDSAGRSTDRTSRSPSRPIATRWPRRSPPPSTTGSWRNHGTTARSPRSPGRASRAAADRAPGAPGTGPGRPRARDGPGRRGCDQPDRAEGDHARSDPVQPSRLHHDGCLLRRMGQLAGGGRGTDPRRQPLSRLTCGSRRGPSVPERRLGGRRGTVPLTKRCVVAKPVRSRHSPATVSVPQRARVRSPTTRCMLEPSRER